MLIFLLFELACGEYAWNHNIEGLENGRPMIIAHRGASGTFPAHTRGSYEAAIEQGADVIECDLAVSKDRKFVCLHDEYLSSVTDVEDRPEFADRKRLIGTKRDWFTIDFTLEELTSLKVRAISSRDQQYNFKYNVVSFAEYVQIAKSANRTIGIYPETKKPDWFEANMPDNFDMETAIVEVLEEMNYSNPTDPCFVQSFSWESLNQLREITDLPLIYLFKSSKIQPGFHPGNFSNFDWTSWTFWDELVKLNIYGVGPDKTLIVGKSADNHVSYVSNLILAAHLRYIGVHPYTFKDDNLLFDYKFSAENEYEQFIELEVDGFFSDFPETLVRHLANRKCKEENTEENTDENTEGSALHTVFSLTVLSVLFL